MMLCCAAGTRMFGFFCERREPQDFARPLFAAAAVALLAPVVAAGAEIKLRRAFLMEFLLCAS